MKRLMFIIVLLPLLGSAQIITTYAGNGTEGYIGDGDAAINAELYYPIGLNFDKNGNLLVCHHLLVRQVDKQSHIISTIAGSDTANHILDNVPATTTEIVEPYAVCIDDTGNYYIVDYWAADIAVRKVSVSTGIITTFAGDKTMGNSGDGGPANQAKFKGIVSICIDTIHHYMYISDAYNYRVRRVDMLTGILSAFAGNGVNGYSGDGSQAINAQFSRVFGLCTDTAGNVYIGDWDNARIRKVDFSSGIVTTIAGNGIGGFGGDGGLAINAMLKKPTAMCFDKQGDLFFTDEDNNRVRKIDMQTGIISTIAGTGAAGFAGDGGPAINAEFNHPTGICIDTMGNIFVGDYYNQRVRKIAMGNAESVNEAILKENICLYPNPAKEQLTVSAGTAATEVMIVNAIGQVLLRQPCGGNKSSINISSLPPGLYYLLLTEQKTGRTQRLKFLKE